MKRLARAALIASIAILVAEAPLAAPTRAQSAAPLPEARTPAETEALELLSDGLYVSARSRAERVLRTDPDSIVGHYVLGRALFDAEGSLARAMFHLGRARELYEPELHRTGGSPFHQELLFQLARLAGQMELFDYQLELLGYLDHLYDPDMIAERCWPLMKLGRMDEARQFAEIAVTSPNPWQRSAGLNAMCAFEGEARAREPYHAACLAALADARTEAAALGANSDEETAGIAVDAYNAALAGMAALRFAEAEQYALEGVRRFEPTGADPWQLLVELYVSEGRMDDALSAFAQMMSWNDRQPAAMRDQGRAETEATVAILLLHAGETARALERIDRALSRPDRRGLTTDGAEQARGRHALLRRIIRRTLDEERAEEASWTGRGAQLMTLVGAIPRMLAGWPDEERIVGVLSNDDRLLDTVRPYVAGGISGLSPWITGDLVSVLGIGVVAVALDDARAADAGEPRAEPAYLALEAELAAARGDSEEAVELVTRALALLEPEPGYALLRARAAAIGAAAAEDAGLDVRAGELYATAMEIDPGVLRRLGLALPVEITSSGGEADEAADLLGRSPRLASRSGAFVLAVTEIPSGLRACLRTASGNELRCAEAREPPPQPDADAEADADADADAETETDADADADAEAAAAAVAAEAALTLPQLLARAVHRELWSARIELSRVDLSSLDGHTIGGSSMANDRLREMLESEDP